MRSYNLLSITVCLLILVVTFITFQNVEPSYGSAILAGSFMYSIFAICALMLIITFLLGIARRTLFNIYTVLNIMIICLTGTSPFWLI